MQAPGARFATFEDGTIVLDPVTGQLVTIAPMALDLLALLRERIEGGVTEREALLDELLAELSTPDEDASEAPTAAARDNLAGWVDLARHLYA